MNFCLVLPSSTLAEAKALYNISLPALPGFFRRIFGGDNTYDFAFCCLPEPRWHCDPLLLLGNAGLLSFFVNHSPGRVAAGGTELGNRRTS